MKNKIIQTGETREFYTNERCYIRELLNTSEIPDLSIAQARVMPGVTTALHALKGVGEAYYILEGEGIMETGEENRTLVGKGDLIWIHPGQAQRITNTGTGDLLFLCVCTPRFELDCYLELE